MEIFVHRRGQDVELHESEPETTIAQLIETLDAPEANVWLEEQENALPKEATLAGAGVFDRANVHVGTCKKVTVSVRFNAQTKTYEVPPAATLQSVYARATSAGEGFGFSEGDRAQYTLQMQGTTEQPELSRHVGAFAGDECTTAFDLVLQDRFQG
jgi:hypothetical protein